MTRRTFFEVTDTVRGMRLRNHPCRAARLAPIVVIALAAAAVGCGGDDDTASDGSFAALLDQLPAVVAEGNVMLEITYGDLAAATDEAGVERPEPDDADAVRDWIAAITGVAQQPPGAHYVQLSESFSPQQLARVDEIREELGWAVADVDQYVTVSDLPRLFTVATMSSDRSDAIDAAVGEPVEGIWSLGGEDLAIDISGVTPARPLGESLRLATKDGLLAASRTTPPIAAWLAGPATALGDNERLRSIAETLDRADVYTAVLLAGGDHSIVAALGAIGTPEDVETLLAESGTLPELFTAIGVGLSVSDDGPSATIVYHHPTADAAADNAEAISETIETGTSLVTGQALSERLSLRDIAVDGNLVVATIDFVETPPNVIFSMLYQRDLPFVHG